jgi:hypothetical protein
MLQPRYNGSTHHQLPGVGSLQYHLNRTVSALLEGVKTNALMDELGQSGRPSLAFTSKACTKE